MGRFLPVDHTLYSCDSKHAHPRSPAPALRSPVSPAARDAAARLLYLLVSSKRCSSSFTTAEVCTAKLSKWQKDKAEVEAAVGSKEQASYKIVA